MLTLFLTLPPHLFKPCSRSSFSLSPWAYLLSPPPIFHLSSPLLSLLVPSSSPPSCPVAEQLSTCTSPTLRTPPPVCSSLPCQSDHPKGFPCVIRSCLSPSSCLPFPSSTCAQVPVGPSFLLSGGPFLPILVSITFTPTPPPFRPQLPDQSPAGTELWNHVLRPPSPVYLPRPHRFILCCLLVSSEVLISNRASFFISERGPSASTTKYRGIPSVVYFV